jgi:ABC-type uncharacterized transport system auxiliary subunit
MSVGAAVACCALAAACTPEPAPSSTTSPSPAATTPSESKIERQMRLDFEAAEKAYRDNMAVVRFVDKSGRDVTPKGASLYVQALTAIREGERWKVSTALTTK